MIMPGDDSTARLADWAELLAILQEKPLSKSEISAILQDYYGNLQEQDIDSVITEIERRGRLYGDSAPFDLNRKLIISRTSWKKIPSFVMCLIFSLYGVQKEKKKDDGAKLFEFLSREAVRVYLAGEAEVIGYPSKTKLRKQIEDLAIRMCEQIGCRCPKPTDKDKGVDVIAWKTHGDNRPNQIVLLLQCGAGSHFSEKQPISEIAWREFVNWSAPVLTGIATPTIIPMESWVEVRDQHKFIFDRARIWKAIYNKTKTADQLEKKIFAWCSEKIKQHRQ